MFLFIKEVWNNILQARRMCKKLHAKRSLISYYLTGRILKDLRQPNHKSIQKNARKLIGLGDDSGYFYLAESCFLQNNLEMSKKYIETFLEEYPHHSDASYLLAQVEVLLGQKPQAKQRMLRLIQHSPRKKTWQVLSNLVDTTIEFDEYEKIFRQHCPHYDNEKLPYDLICHLSNAAQRGNRDDFALSLWRGQYRFLKNNSSTKSKATTPTKKYTNASATVALQAIKQCFDKAKISFFLISGTLLGCIREGKLLGHDKDIDIGIWDEHTIADLVSVIRNSGCFYVLPNYSQDILVVRHTNGTTIDIFRHYREPNDYWHAGGKSSWHNSPFELIPYYFLGENYLIPKDYDLYLTENYGDDWCVPKIDFDSALDTPNMRVVSNEKMLIYFYKRLFELNDKGSTNMIKRFEASIQYLKREKYGSKK